MPPPPESHPSQLVLAPGCSPDPAGLTPPSTQWHPRAGVSLDQWGVQCGSLPWQQHWRGAVTLRSSFLYHTGCQDRGQETRNWWENQWGERLPKQRPHTGLQFVFVIRHVFISEEGEILKCIIVKTFVF